MCKRQSGGKLEKARYVQDRPKKKNEKNVFSLEGMGGGHSNTKVIKIKTGTNRGEEGEGYDTGKADGLLKQGGTMHFSGKAKWTSRGPTYGPSIQTTTLP